MLCCSLPPGMAGSPLSRSPIRQSPEPSTFPGGAATPSGWVHLAHDTWLRRLALLPRLSRHAALQPQGPARAGGAPGGGAMRALLLRCAQGRGVKAVPLRPPDVGDAGGVGHNRALFMPGRPCARQSGRPCVRQSGPRSTLCPDVRQRATRGKAAQGSCGSFSGERCRTNPRPCRGALAASSSFIVECSEVVVATGRVACSKIRASHILALFQVTPTYLDCVLTRVAGSGESERERLYPRIRAGSWTAHGGWRSTVSQGPANFL
jgi:hypothetical protein